MARPPHRSEFQRIARIQRILNEGGTPSSAIERGIGDDAAILRARGRLVWSIDASVEAVHFERRWLSLADVGFRSFQAAVSDLAAMGSQPLAALSNLALPADFTDRQLELLVFGQAQASLDADCPIVGGNLTSAKQLSVTTSVLGRSTRPLLRSGAKAGDELWLVGEVGLAAAGLRALQSGRALRGAALKRCVQAWRRPRALLAEGVKLASCARAALDVSDGLAGDAAHLAEASGARVVIEAASLRDNLAAELFRVAAWLGADPLQLALFGGEDYALLATGAARRRPSLARRIGRVVAGRGVVLERGPGHSSRLGPGFDHFQR